MMTISIGFMQVSMWSATADIVDRCTSVRSQQSIPASIFVFWGEQVSTYSLRGIRRGNVPFFMVYVQRPWARVKGQTCCVFPSDNRFAARRPGSSCRITLDDFGVFQDVPFPYTADLDVCRCLQFRDSFCPLTWCTQLPKTALVSLTCIRQP